MRYPLLTLLLYIYNDSEPPFKNLSRGIHKYQLLHKTNIVLIGNVASGADHNSLVTVKL